MLQERDYNVITFLNQFKAAKTSQVQSLFYPSKRVAQAKLKKISEYGESKRVRYGHSDEYIYYTCSSKKQIRHHLLLTDYYCKMKREVTVVKFIKEFSHIKGIRPDGFMAYEDSTGKHIEFIEVEVSNKGLDLKKYYDCFINEKHKNILPVFPRIKVITDKNYKNPYPMDVEFIKCN